MRYYYTIKDDKSGGGANPVPLDDNGVQYISKAVELNKKGFGVFRTVNSFKTPVRKKENIKALNYFFVDIDGNPNEGEVKSLLKKGLPPSLVVKTKNGYHVYWKFERPVKATQEAVAEYESILKYALIPFYKADLRASNITTLLRAPGFYHNKGEPYMVEVEEENAYTYTLSEFAYHYKRPEAAKVVKEFKRKPKAGASLGFWGAVCDLPCMESLEKLSGHPGVGGEVFSFRKNSSGHQIFCNDKSTSCWVDDFNLIGSHDKGGPTIGNFIYWYQKDWFKVSQIIREVFPEII